MTRRTSASAWAAVNPACKNELFAPSEMKTLIRMSGKCVPQNSGYWEESG